jgi:hypothetical protein
MTTEEQFNVFWKAFPRRVAKGHARTAFDRAIRKTTLETMLKAIEDYIRFKPERIDFKHPATWLNAESWEDEWADVPRETNRKRNFVDAARDRLNGRQGVNGTYADAQRLSDGQQQPGSDGGHVRNGYVGPFIASRH